MSPVLPTLDAREICLLTQFEQAFGVTSLGEGDLATGINVLTAYALTIANLSPHESLVNDNNNVKIKVGMNLVVSGSLSCSIIHEHVVRVLQLAQSNANDHVSNHLLHLQQRQPKADLISSSGFYDKKNIIPALSAYDNGLHLHQGLDKRVWTQLLQRPMDATIAAFVNAPVFFASVGSVEQISDSLRYANGGRILMHTELGRESNIKLLERLQRDVIAGSSSAGILQSINSGALLVIDPHRSYDAIQTDDANLDLLTNMAWVGDFAGEPPLVTEGSPVTQKQPGPDTPRWFDRTLIKTLANRLDVVDSKPVVIIEASIGRDHRTWMQFLQLLEPRCPGIVGMLRTLYASLVFGVISIMQTAAQLHAPGPNIHTAHVCAVAKFLALRMVAHREHLLGSARNRTIEALAQRIRHKLADGPQNVRDLTRRFNRLDSRTCADALARLADSGVVQCSGGYWSLVDSKIAQPKSPIIDV